MLLKTRQYLVFGNIFMNCYVLHILRPLDSFTILHFFCNVYSAHKIKVLLHSVHTAISWQDLLSLAQCKQEKGPTLP